MISGPLLALVYIVLRAFRTQTIPVELLLLLLLLLLMGLSRDPIITSSINDV